MPFIASNGLTEAGTSSSIAAGGMNVHYHDVGKGEPVILVHGFAGNLTMWRPLIADLANNHEVIALDCRGQEKATNRTRQNNMGLKW